MNCWKPGFGALLLVLIAAAAALGQTPVSVGDLAGSPATYHGDAIKVSGTIASYQQRATGRGTPYASFRLQAEGSSIPVFAGRPKGLRNGQRVRITGMFVKSKRVGRETFRNAIEAIRVDILAK
jgi:hypothetical protein